MWAERGRGGTALKHAQLLSLFTSAKVFLVRFEGCNTLKFAFWRTPPPVTKTIYANAEESTPGHRSRCSPTGCRAGRQMFRLLWTKAVDGPALRQELHLLGAIWKMAEGSFGCSRTRTHRESEDADWNEYRCNKKLQRTVYVIFGHTDRSGTVGPHLRLGVGGVGMFLRDLMTRLCWLSTVDVRSFWKESVYLFIFCSHINCFGESISNADKNPLRNNSVRVVFICIGVDL